MPGGKCGQLAALWLAVGIGINFFSGVRVAAGRRQIPRIADYALGGRRGMGFPRFFALSLKNRITALMLAVFLLGVWSVTLWATGSLRRDMMRLLGGHRLLDN